MMISNKDRILVIAAHPDDEILGCGGLLSKYSSKTEISILFIAEGDSCRFNSSELTPVLLKEIKHREECAKEALNVFNIDDIHFNNLPCGRLDSFDIIDINKVIEKKILSFQPSIILSHYSHDINNDHRVVSRSVEMSTRPVNNFNINTFSYEILSSTEWNLQNPFKPNTFVQLSEDDLQNKIKALKIYDGEIRDFPHSRSEDGIISLSKYRGMQVGVNYAEAFYTNRLYLN